MKYSTKTPLTIEVTVAEAMVLVALAKKAENLDELSDDEKQALWNLECYLETKLTEPYIDDYPKMLELSRKSITQK